MKLKKSQKKPLNPSLEKISVPLSSIIVFSYNTTSNASRSCVGTSSVASDTAVCRVETTATEGSNTGKETSIKQGKCKRKRVTQEDICNLQYDVLKEQRELHREHVKRKREKTELQIRLLEKLQEDNNMTLSGSQLALFSVLN